MEMFSYMPEKGVNGGGNGLRWAQPLGGIKPGPDPGWRVPGVMEKGGLNPRSLRKTPGLAKVAFSENRVKRPDSIPWRYCPLLANRALLAVFRSWVDFPFFGGKQGIVRSGKKGPPKRDRVP